MEPSNRRVRIEAHCRLRHAGLTCKPGLRGSPGAVQWRTALMGAFTMPVAVGHSPPLLRTGSR